MLYTANITIDPQSPESMVVIVTVCTAFGLTVSGNGFKTRGVLEATVTFSIEAADQVCNQARVFLWGNVMNDAKLSNELDECTRDFWYRF